MKRRPKKGRSARRAFVAMALLLMPLALFFVFVGPWPAYDSRDLTDYPLFQDSVRRLMDAVEPADPAPVDGALRAGWAARSIVPDTPGPLAGYGARRGATATGTRDPLHAKAVALSDGVDTVVLLGGDVLVVPGPLAARIRAGLAEDGLARGQVMFTATHTHSGPGGIAPGPLARLFAGRYDPDQERFMADRFIDAAREALEAMAPAEVAWGSVAAPEYARNRAREGPVDDYLDVLVFRRDDGASFHVVRYSAHATVLGPDNTEYSADYPGYLQRAIEDATGGMALFIAGGVGSMGPAAPGDARSFEKARVMGEDLAEMALTLTRDLRFAPDARVASVGEAVHLPPLQLRVKPALRLSPLFLRMMGIDGTAWVHGLRVGPVMLMGFPADFSGEISVDLRHRAAERGIELWATSFSGDYVGYVSPDKYYDALYADDGSLAYETGLMSWCGPDQERYFSALTTVVRDLLFQRGNPL